MVGRGLAVGWVLIFFVVDYKVDRILFNKYKYIRLESFCLIERVAVGRRGCWGAVVWCGGVVGKIYAVLSIKD